MCSHFLKANYVGWLMWPWFEALLYTLKISAPAEQDDTMLVDITRLVDESIMMDFKKVVDNSLDQGCIYPSRSFLSGRHRD